MRQATTRWRPLAALGPGQLRWALALSLRWALALSWWLALGWWLRRELRSALGGGLGAGPAPAAGPPTRPRRPKQARSALAYPRAA